MLPMQKIICLWWVNVVNAKISIVNVNGMWNYVGPMEVECFHGGRYWMANKVFGGNQIEMNAHHQYHAYHEYHCKQIFECMLSVEREEKKQIHPDKMILHHNAVWSLCNRILIESSIHNWWYNLECFLKFVSNVTHIWCQDEDLFCF